MYEEGRYFPHNKFQGKVINNEILKNFHVGVENLRAKIPFLKSNLEEKHLFDWMIRMLASHEYFVVHREQIFVNIQKLAQIMENLDVSNIQKITQLYPFLLNFKNEKEKVQFHEQRYEIQSLMK